MYDGFLKAYLAGSGDSSYFTVSLTDRSESFQWNEAYLIAGVEDAYNSNKAANRQTLITGLLNRYVTKNFVDHNSTTLGWDTYNDDDAWAALALTRGYQITANTTYLTLAANVWNNSYNRGWQSQSGGGILEVQHKSVKCELSNDSFVPSAIILYQATGDASYLTKAEAIHAWVRKNFYDTTDGHVNGCTGQPSDAIYDDGLYIEAATELFRITGDEQYYDDAMKTADLEIGKHPIMTEDYLSNGPFGADQFFRGLSNFARENNLWSRYSAWFQNNAAAAWNERRTDYNITHDDLATPTPTTGSSNMSAMEMESAMVLQQVAGVADVINPFQFSGKYELLNVTSNLAVSVGGGSTATDAAIVQEPFTGGSEALFTLAATGGGYYTIQNVKSGLFLNVEDASTVDGAKIVQWTAQPQRPGNDRWLPVANADGTYSFFNLNSQQVIDNFGGSVTAGNQFAQWVADGHRSQEFRLISH